jgi:hypothetical protein
MRDKVARLAGYRFGARQRHLGSDERAPGFISADETFARGES